MRTHTRLGRNMLHFTKGLVVGFWGLSSFFFFRTPRRGRVRDCGRVGVLQNFMPGFCCSLSLPSILFITLSTTPNCIAESPTAFKETGSIGEKGEGNGHACLKAADSTTTTHQSKQRPRLLFFFCDLSTDRTPPGSSTHHIPAVYCKSNEKITIKIW